MSEVTTHNGTAQTQVTAPASTPAKVSDAKLAEYKEKYVKLDDKVVAAKEAYDKALAARGEFCKKFAEDCGKGKYRIREEILTLTSRKGKNSDTETFYFRGKTDDEEVR
jgi:hypothetical protein